MVALGLPAIVFSEWVLWTARATLKGIDAPGIYVLAHFTIAPAGSADPLTQEVIYVGETCSQFIRRRWQQFHACAFEGKRGHSGGVTYRKCFVGGDIEKLYVACFPIGNLLNDSLRPLFIRHVERKLILDYAVKWGAAPRCNRK